MNTSAESAPLPISAGARAARATPVQLPFFVYGTLLPGQPNYRLWDRSIAAIVPATLRDSALFDLGFYPILVEGSGEFVLGALVHVIAKHYERALATLDDLEGFVPAEPVASIYRRVKRVVFDAGRRPHVAWVYVGSPAHVEGLSPIGPDWKLYAREKDDAIREWWHRSQSA